MRNRLDVRGLALPFLVLLFSCSFVSAEETLEETFSKTYPLSESGRVSLENVNGDLRIEVWDRAELKVEAVKQASSAEYLKELEIDVRPSANAVEIITNYPDHHHGHHWSRSSGSGGVDYTLTVPRRASIERVSLVNGDLTVTGAEGGLEAELVNGKVTASGLAGTVRLETVNGAINLRYDRLSVKERIAVEAVNGHIEVALPAAASARLRASTVSGHLRNDFGIEVDKHHFVGASMEGRIGKGEADITMETVSGSITVSKL